MPESDEELQGIPGNAARVNESVRVMGNVREVHQAELIEEIRREFRDYSHYDIGFGGLLKAMLHGKKDEALLHAEFRREVKYELKLVMNYLHMVRDRNTIREIKTSTFPILLLGAAGNRTAIKLVMISTYLSAKAMPFVAETFERIISNPANRSAEFVGEVYAQMLTDLRTLASRESYYGQKPPTPARDRKLAAFSRLRLRKKNELRARLGLPYLNAQPDDPYRSLPVTRVIAKRP